MKHIRLLLYIVLLSGLVPVPLTAVDIGGNMAISGGASYQDDLEFQYAGGAELEFYLPSSRDVDIRLVLRGSLQDPLQQEIGIKYAYLRYHTEHGHITAGRQPVSWSYGAIFHPLDYRVSLDGFAGISVTPEIDGVRAFRHLGDRSSLQGAVSFPAAGTYAWDDLTYGIRLRTPVPGHDISTQAVFSSPLLRTGVSYSGDLGPMGLYGAAGYLLNTDDMTHDAVLQAGIDYSTQVGPEHEEKMLFLQAEYMRFIMKNLGSQVLEQVPFAKDLTVNDLFAGIVTLELSHFTRTGIAVVAETADWAGAVTPFFETELKGGLELLITASALRNSGGDFNFLSGIQLKHYF